MGAWLPQGLTAVWTALKDAEISKVFSVPQHKRPLSNSSSRHRAYLPFRETVPLECLPLLLPILKPTHVYTQGEAAGSAATPVAPETAATPHAAAPTDASVSERGYFSPDTLAAAATAAAARERVTAADAAAADAAAVGLRSSALLHSACCEVLLEVLCEETRLLRLDHTTNTSMIAALASALADMQVRPAELSPSWRPCLC